MSEHYLKLLAGITTLMFDVDGVLTDGSVTIMPDGQLLRTLNARDGFALQLAVKKGLRVVIVTGGRSMAIKERLESLGIEDIYLGARHKLTVLEEYIKKHCIKLSEILYMGDDIPDYEVMSRVGIPACPHDAAYEILEISKYISDFPGGKGAARDVIEKVLRAKNLWFTDDSDFKW